MTKLSLQDIFINNLKYYRKQQKLSQEALSEKLNKGMSYINKIESRLSFPTIQVVEQIAEALGVKASQLFEDSSAPHNIIGADRERFILEVTDTLYERLTSDMRKILEQL